MAHVRCPKADVTINPNHVVSAELLQNNCILLRN